MKQLGFVFGLMTVVALGPPAMIRRSVAWGQAAARDETGEVTATPGTRTEKNHFEQQFAESYAELSTYVGTGTFYTRGYHDPYVSNALYLKPVYQLGTRFGLNLNARFYFETEYTQPDNPQARHFYPLDPWIRLSAKNLYTAPVSRIRLGGFFRLVVPLSYESRYANLVTSAAVAGTATRQFRFGRADASGKRWMLVLVAAEVFNKNVHSSVLRGNGPGDSTGCMATGTVPSEAGAATPGAAATDRCGGPLNTNFDFTTSVGVSLLRGRWEFDATVILINQFRYEAPSDAFSATNTPLGRADQTWGLLAVGYEIRPRLGVGLGLSSLQPALDSRYRYPRFPFFDFSGTNANNFTQLFVNVNGTL